MNLIVHRGAAEIGGTCIELCSGNTRVILDCGLPLQDQSAEGMINTGDCLPIPGLFGEGPTVHGIVLSHAHPDHAGLIEQTNPSVPVYATRACFKMVMAASIFANQPQIGKERENAMKLGVPLRIGSFQITAFPVDHSIAGACAFVIEVEGKRILYTGDLRFHGRKPGMRTALVDACQRNRLDLVITEGTALSRPKSEGFITEDDLERTGVELVRERGGLVAAHFSPLNLDRLVSFLRIAKKTGRTFVTDPYGAYVLLLARSEGVRVPDPCESRDIRILIPEGFWQTRAGRVIAAHRSRMEAASIGISDVLDTSGRFLMLWRPSMLKTVFRDSLPEGTLCLRSFWKGYLDTDNERQLAADFIAGGVEQRHLHSSGHASRSDLVKFLKEVDTQSIIVVHSENPEALREEFTNVVTVEDGVSITV